MLLPTRVGQIEKRHRRARMAESDGNSSGDSHLWRPIEPVEVEEAG